jgi:hypothetical protein
MQFANASLQEALSTGNVKPIQVAALSPNETRGNEERFLAQFPVSEAIEEDRPLFRWKPNPGVQKYLVRVDELIVQSGQEESVTRASAETTQTYWQPKSPLPRGKTLQWSVALDMPDGRKRQKSRFIVLSPAQVEEVHFLVYRLGGSPVKRGILYWKYGLFGKANAEFDAVKQGESEYKMARVLQANLRKQWGKEPIE